MANRSIVTSVEEMGADSNREAIVPEKMSRDEQ